jgi:hypothetical protein
VTLRHFILIALCLIPCAHAQGPRMTVRGTETILAIHAAEITVRTTGGIAETEMLLTFRNDTDRAVEGEFTLPLPAGATVSNYALEVNGSLREAVAVEKERALLAYETIKRQMIDPGIVERQAGNVYRTRIFPVLANSTKQLRIGYVEVLPAGPNGFTYQCPLRFSPAPAHTTVTIHGPTPTWRGEPKLNFVTSPEEATVHALQLRDTAIEGTLEITTPLPAEPQLHAERGEAPHFLWSGRFPAMPEKPRPTPNHILLFWDASESSADRDPTRELKLLDSWFKKLGNTTVELRLLRNQITRGGIHPITVGDWSSLRKAIEAADREGSTSLTNLTDSNSKADLVIYCGDGQATTNPLMGLVSKPLIVLHTSATQPTAALTDAARRTGGVVIPVDRTEPPDALRLLTIEPFRVMAVNGSRANFHLLDDAPLAPGQPVRLIGKWPTGPLPALEIAFGSGTEIHTRLSAPKPIIDSQYLLRRLHAQKVLAALESASQPDRRAILNHCRTHNLASDVTSLIVLERFEDHIRYEIPPPEPDLRKRYNIELSKKEPREIQLMHAWKLRVRQHRRPLPGHEVILLPRFKQVGIWKDAVTSVFQPNEIDPTSFSIISGWHERALAVIERRDNLKSLDEFKQWLETISELHIEGRTLTETPINPPPPGQPLAASVRGLVLEPGVVRTDPGLTLLQAIELAGGPLLNSRPERVALYRNAGKTLYNVRSRDFKDFALLRADMIVLEDSYGNHSDVDPFAAAPSDPADQPAIAQQQDVWVAATGANHALPFGNGSSITRPGVVKLVDPSNTDAPDLTEFSNKIAGGADPQATWRELKAGRRLPTRVHIDAARVLFQNRHDALATTVLSTVVERGQGTLPSRLAEAFWLADFGKTELADAHIAAIEDPDHAAQIAFARASIAPDPAISIRNFGSAIHLPGDTNFNLITLTELNHHPAALHPFFPGLEGTLPCDLRITVQNSQPAVTPDIVILDPLGDPVSLHSPTSPTGGRLTAAPGLAEFIIRRAIPGTYTIRAKSETDATLRIAIHSGWGTPEQKTTRTTVQIDPFAVSTTLGSIDFEFTPSPPDR